MFLRQKERREGAVVDFGIKAPSQVWVCLDCKDSWSEDNADRCVYCQSKNIKIKSLLSDG